VKVQLVEFRNDVVWSSYPTLLNSPHNVLPSVYNTSYITGPVFVNEAYSRVSYHQKNPAVNDEVCFCVLFFGFLEYVWDVSFLEMMCCLNDKILEGRSIGNTCCFLIYLL